MVRSDPDEGHDEGHGSSMSFEIYVPDVTETAGPGPADEGGDDGHGH